VNDEPFQSLWVLASGFMALGIWFFIDRYIDHRKNKS
jgi:hypothetical protein